MYIQKKDGIQMNKKNKSSSIAIGNVGSDENVRNIRVKSVKRDVFISEEDFVNFGLHIIKDKPKKKRILKP